MDRQEFLKHIRCPNEYEFIKPSTEFAEYFQVYIDLDLMSDGKVFTETYYWEGKISGKDLLKSKEELEKLRESVKQETIDKLFEIVQGIEDKKEAKLPRGIVKIDAINFHKEVRGNK